jgi:putative heme-binding domain-containing protein
MMRDVRERGGETMRQRPTTWAWVSVWMFACCAAAGQLSAQRGQTDHPGGAAYSRVDIEAGARLYQAACAGCHGANGDQVGTVQLRTGRYRRAVSDPDLRTIIVNGIPDSGMPSHKFTQPELSALVAYLRNMGDFDGRLVTLGDATSGKLVFEGKGGCTKCHRVNGNGARVAPDLSDIGTQRTAGALERSLVDPSAAMVPINQPVRIRTKDGRTINGRRLNEDTFTVQLMDDKESLISLDKSDLREYTLLTRSPMPSYKGTLSPAEIADLVAFLVSLKGSL